MIGVQVSVKVPGPTLPCRARRDVGRRPLDSDMSLPGDRGGALRGGMALPLQSSRDPNPLPNAVGVHLGPHTSIIAACLAGLGWVYWLVESTKAKEIHSTCMPEPSAPSFLLAVEKGGSAMGDDMEASSTQNW